MAVATGALIGAGITAAASWYASHKASEAAKEAATSETAAADKALAVQERMYNQQRQDTEPWTAAGRAALGRLGDLSQAPRPMFDPTQPGMSRAFRGAAGFVDSTGQDRNMAATGGGVMGEPRERALVNGPSALTTPNVGGGGLGQLGAPGGQMGGPPPAMPQRSQMVLMQAPDGSAPRPIPAGLVAQFQAKGAKVVPQ